MLQVKCYKLLTGAVKIVEVAVVVYAVNLST